MDSFSQVSTVFDRDKEGPHGILYSRSIQNTLLKVLPPFASEESFASHLPIVKWAAWGEQGLQLSVYLLCSHRVNGVKFFYEMISRWLMPGRRLDISSFFATDFRLSALSCELFTVGEIVISLENGADLELIRHQLPIIESEIRMGLTSVYHANRVLEIKGLSADEKTSLIQERIAALLKRRPKDFDHDIFAQMQHFLVMCSEEFKALREYGHMSRIIYVFYFFRRMLREQIENNPDQRFVHVKVSRAYLHHPFGLKKVLGLFAALNFQGDHELFEERHFAAVLANHHLSVVEGSFFFRTSREEKIQILYLEAEGSDFTLEEMKSLKEKLPGEIKNGIEKLARHLFMPRNEEEVMRNIITLSHELRWAQDLPQVIINFESEEESELCFTVICLRVLKNPDLSLQEMFERSGSFLRFALDRIKQIGLLRKKYPKEAAVFRVALSAQHFLRPDHSVDLFRARQAIVQELQRILGEFRDFNGGMIAKQHEQFIALRRLFSEMDKNQELLLENFFHSIFPIEHRSVSRPEALKNLFLMLFDGGQREASDAHGCYFLFAGDDCVQVEMSVRELQIPSSRLLTVSLEHSGVAYLGYIYFEEEKSLRREFSKKIASLFALET